MMYVTAGVRIGKHEQTRSSYRNDGGPEDLTAIKELNATVLKGFNELKEALAMKKPQVLQEELALKELKLEELKEELALKELKLEELKEELAMMKARDKGAAASAQQTQVQNDQVTSPVLSKSSPFIAASHPMGSSRFSGSYRNDDNRYIDDNLVKKLQRTRKSVMQLMNKAEGKQFTEPDIKKWLVRIKHTMYDANTLLDKIDTETRFSEKYKEDGSHDEGFVQWATSEINRIIEELKDTVEEAGDIGLKARDEGAAASARVTSSVLSKSTIVYGRKEEKARILKQVLYSPESAAPGNKPEVIAIVGMGGIGKTTLAQYVYHHPDVERCFTRSRSWACVSDNFDLVRVTRDILEGLTEIPVGISNLASLQLQLEKQLTGKRFLVVLDDTWDFSKQNWEKLMAPFSTGAVGSKIILTTRDTRVAGVVPVDHSFQLKSLSEDEAWSLFLCEVFPDGELSHHPKLEAMGKEIVKKCQGLPLAINALSGLLRSDRKEVKWERVRASSLWQLPEVQKFIDLVLGLSYSYLPSHLKTCFAYCSLFPKDYEFSKKELVNLWVDEGFLQQPNADWSIEDVGVAAFEDLSSRGFFTLLYENEEDAAVYVMDDFFHDLAQMVFADFHLQLSGHKAVKECKKVRHISLHDHRECSSFSILEVLNQAESLQTFMVQYEPKDPRWGLDYRVLEDVLLQRLSLRVLCLAGARIRTLPDTISNLKQLRCLDVSYTDVEEFPASLCKLYNLRRLLCESCDQIKEFHCDMAAFVSLRHFTLSGRQLQKAPWNLSQLSQVKLEFYLPYSVGDGSDSSGSRDTKEGSVYIAIVDGANVTDSGDEQEGEVDVALDQAESDSNHTESGLHVIVNIDRSTFRFDTDGKDAFIASDLLQSLRPHRDVKEVRIEKFNGTEFPGWLVDRSYHNIEKVTLVKCWISSGLMPALGGLPSLKHLRLEGVRNVKKLGSELYNSTVPFGSLEELYFGYMNEWEEWEPSDDAVAEGICFFPCLQKLSIVSCPKLKGRLPSNLPALKMLHIDSCSSLVELNGCHRQLVDLEISECGPEPISKPGDLPKSGQRTSPREEPSKPPVEKFTTVESPVKDSPVKKADDVGFSTNALPATDLGSASSPVTPKRPELKVEMNERTKAKPSLSDDAIPLSARHSDSTVQSFAFPVLTSVVDIRSSMKLTIDTTEQQEVKKEEPPQESAPPPPPEATQTSWFSCLSCCSRRS